MRDLTFFNDGNNKRLKNGLYNFSKLRTMVHKVCGVTEGERGVGEGRREKTLTLHVLYTVT